MSSVRNPTTIIVDANAVRAAGWDGIGMLASCLCVVHCLGFPLLIASLPALATMFGEGYGFHLAILAIAIPSSLFALLIGRGRHRAWWPLVVGCIGLTSLGLAVLEVLPDVAGTVAGSVMLVAAHIANWRYRSAATA